jgi:predicted HicB family RNase H-like nuclease
MGARMSRPVEVIIEDFPPKIRSRLVKEAKRRDVSVNDLAASILAEHYGIGRESSGARFIEPRTEGRMIFRVPPDVHAAIQADVQTITGLVTRAIADYFDMPAPPPTRRRRAA